MTDLSFRLFLFLLAFAPLAFGTVEHWSLMIVEIGAASALLIWLIGARRSGEDPVRVPGMVPLVLMLCFIAFQLVPLPIGLLQLIAPSSWLAYQPVYEVSGRGEWLPISVNQKATLQELLRIGAYSLFYILTVQLLRTSARISATLNLLALLGGGIAAVAILQLFSGDGLIYWFRPAPGGHPGGPWININQFAAFIAALCPVVLAQFLYYRPPGSHDSSLRERVVSLFESPQSNLHLFLGFGFVLMTVSVFVSLCRGGIVTILLSMILFVALSSYRRRNVRNSAFWGAFCIVLLGVSWFGWQPIVDEFDKVFDAAGAISDARMQLWSDTLVMIRDYLPLGSGFGTYLDAYPSYRTIPGTLIFDHAHNDYLELLSDGGLVGFGLAAWFCIAVLGHGLRRVMARGDRQAVLVGLGTITALCALLMHSFVDFNLHNGAVGLYFFFLCGLLTAVVNHRYRRFREETLLSSINPAVTKVLPLIAGAFALCSALVQTGILIAAYTYNQTSHIYLTRHLSPKLVDAMKADLHTAMRFDPLDGRYPFTRGNLALIYENRDDAAARFLDAARLQPMQGIYLQRIAMMQPSQHEALVRELMASGHRRALAPHRLVTGWVEWLLMTGRRAEALDHLRESLQEDQQSLADLLPMLHMHDITREELSSILPFHPDPWIRCGSYLEKIEDINGAAYFRERALTYMEDQEKINPAWLTQLITFHRRHNQPEKALNIIRLGVEKVPDYAPFHVWLGDHYRREGITYRAREEYQQAVLLAPNNKSYRRKLDQLGSPPDPTGDSAGRGQD